MLRQPTASDRLKYAGRIGLLAALYFAVGKVSLLTAIPPGYATSVWPPSGLALAAILLLGGRYWPGVWIGATLVNVTVQSSLPAAVLIGTGNALEALAGAAMIRHFIGVPRRFQRGEDVFGFVALAAVASTIAATVGTFSVAIVQGGAWGDLSVTWWTWWQGDTCGMIVVTPLLLTWTAGLGGAWTSRRKLVLAGFAALLLVAGYAAFGSGFTTRFSPLLLVLTLLPVIWIAVRFDQPEVTATIAALCAFAVGYTVLGRGPLAGGSIEESLFQLLVFISIVAVTGLAISAVVGERRRAMEALRASRDELESRVAQRTRDLAQSEETFRLLVEGIQDYAIFMLDPQGRIMSWNRGAAKITGYEAEEIIGHDLAVFYARDGTERFWPQQELALARAQGRFEDEGWRLRKDGTRFWANVIITALYDSPGHLRGFAKITRDMTQRKRIEALEHTERRMNEFLAMLGHELRNPLAPIRNALDLMRMKPADDPIQHWSRDVIDRQVTQLTRLVDDLLDVGRITSGKIRLQRERIDLHTAVLRAVESCRAMAEARRQTLRLQRSDDPLPIDGDLIRVSQIVVNLLHNAIKYTPEDGRIDVTVGRDGDFALVRVSDTGIGISADLLPDVFDLFVQGQRSLARTEGGLGIGLTIVRQLVALHGGTVVARSDGPDRGSEFIVLLPALAREPAAVVPRPDPPPAAASSKRRVLIVDDNRDSADGVTALLAAWGHDVRAVYDGPAAIAAASSDHPDVVLLDIGLPGMSGYEVAKRLRAMPHLRPFVLIAFTGYGQDDDRQRVREAGFDHHLVKPIDTATLERIIEAIAVPTAS
jgi:PAS domain S-box-containing protein